MIPIVDDILRIGEKVFDRIFPDPAQKEKAVIELNKMAQDGEIQRLAMEGENYRAEQQAVTARHGFDMQSDSWLSKNIRPLLLIFLVLTFLTFAIMSAYKINIDKEYIFSIKEFINLGIGFYFGGRTLEKASSGIINFIKNKKR